MRKILVSMFLFFICGSIYAYIKYFKKEVKVLNYVIPLNQSIKEIEILKGEENIRVSVSPLVLKLNEGFFPAEKDNVNSIFHLMKNLIIHRNVAKKNDFSVEKQFDMNVSFISGETVTLNFGQFSSGRAFVACGENVFVVIGEELKFLYNDIVKFLSDRTIFKDELSSVVCSSGENVYKFFKENNEWRSVFKLFSGFVPFKIEQFVVQNFQDSFFSFELNYSNGSSDYLYLGPSVDDCYLAKLVSNSKSIFCKIKKIDFNSFFKIDFLSNMSLFKSNVREVIVNKEKYIKDGSDWKNSDGNKLDEFSIDEFVFENIFLDKFFVSYEFINDNYSVFLYVSDVEIDDCYYAKLSLDSEFILCKVKKSIKGD